MFVTNWNSTTKIQKISEITNFFRHYFLSRTEVISRHIVMDYTYNLISIHIYLLILNSNQKMFNPFITSSIMSIPPLSSRRYFDGLPRS